jgi:hypothetical protein
MLVLAVCFFAASGIPRVAAQDDSAKNDVKIDKGTVTVKERNIIRSVPKEITGIVSAISKSYIAVTYLKDNKSEIEMGLLIEKLPQLERVADISQIQLGSTVTVQYDEATEKEENGEEINRHVVRKIVFIKPAPQQLQSEDTGGQ